LVYHMMGILTIPLEILDCSIKMSEAVESPSLRKAVEAIYALNSSID